MAASAIRKMPDWSWRRRFLSAALLAGLLLLQLAAALRAKLCFNDHIQPILAENCYACHGTDPGSRKADLRLDRGEHAYRKRKEGEPAIIPGKPDASPLVKRIESKDEKKIMPPPEAHKTLKAG